MTAAPSGTGAAAPADTGLLRCLLTSTAALAVVVVDADLRVRATGPGVRALLGWPEGSLTGRRAAELLVPLRPVPAPRAGTGGGPQPLPDVVTTALLEGSLHGRWQLRTADGGLRTAVLTASLDRDEHGRVRGGALVATEVQTADHARDRLADSAEQFRLVFEKSPTAMAVVSLEAGTRGRIRRANAAMEALTGRRRRELSSLVMADLLHPDEHEAHHGYLRSAALDRLTEPDGVLRRFVHRDGSVRLGRKSTALVTPRGAREPYLLVQVTDVTRHHEAVADLADSVEQFRLVFDESPTAMAVVGLAAGARGRIRRANAAMAAFTGRPAEELLQGVMADLLHPDELEAHRGYLRSAAEDGLTEPRGVLRRFVHRDGGVRLARKSTALVTPRGAAEPHLLVQLEDVTEQHAAQEALAHAALHDALTGLANRALFADRLDHAIAAEARAQRGLTLLYADLDAFKPVNDQHGHAAGDAVLVEVAERLRRGVREEDTVARLGGDEFAVVCPGLAEEHVATVVGRLVASVARPFALPSGAVVDLGVSVGAATAVGRVPAGELVRAADAEMYRVKHGRGAAGRPGR